MPLIASLEKAVQTPKRDFFISLVEYSHTETYTSRSSTLSLSLLVLAGDNTGDPPWPPPLPILQVRTPQT